MTKQNGLHQSLLSNKVITMSVPFEYHFERAYYPDCDRFAAVSHIVLDEDYIVKKKRVGLDLQRTRKIPQGQPLCSGSDNVYYQPIKDLRPFTPTRKKIKICKNCLSVLLAYSDSYIDPSLF